MHAEFRAVLRFTDLVDIELIVLLDRAEGHPVAWPPEWRERLTHAGPQRAQLLG